MQKIASPLFLYPLCKMCRIIVDSATPSHRHRAPWWHVAFLFVSPSPLPRIPSKREIIIVADYSYTTTLNPLLFNFLRLLLSEIYRFNIAARLHREQILGNIQWPVRTFRIRRGWISHESGRGAWPGGGGGGGVDGGQAKAGGTAEGDRGWSLKET